MFRGHFPETGVSRLAAVAAREHGLRIHVIELRLSHLICARTTLPKHHPSIPQSHFPSLKHHPQCLEKRKSLLSNRCAIGAVSLHPSNLSSSSHVLCSHINTNVSQRTSPNSSSENSVPPTLLATLITAQHARPFQPLPMLFAPMLLFSSYLNLSDYKTDAAGITAAWSGLYGLLALRRSQVRLSFSTL